MLLSRRNTKVQSTNIPDHYRHRPNRPSNCDINLHNHIFHIHFERHPVLHQHIQRPPPTDINYKLTNRRSLWSLRWLGYHRTRYHQLLLLYRRSYAAFAVLRRHAAERTLIDLAFFGARERHAPMFELSPGINADSPFVLGGLAIWTASAEVLASTLSPAAKLRCSATPVCQTEVEVLAR